MNTIKINSKIEEQFFPKDEFEAYIREMTYYTNNHFDDDKWTLDKMNNNQNRNKSTNTIYFKSKYPSINYLEKHYALSNLGISRVGSIRHTQFGVKIFMDFYVDILGKKEITEITQKDLNEFQIYLTKSKYAKRSQETIYGGIKNFINFLIEYSKCNLQPIRHNPFTVKKNERKNDDKYLDETTMKKLDVLFNDDSIPLEYRVTYWIGRLIPSRITEITSMTIDCIVKNQNDFILIIPEFKGRRNPNKPNLRKILLRNDDMGAYLLNLINLQIESSRALQQKIENIEDRNWLITYNQLFYNPHKGYFRHPELIISMKEATFNKFLRDIIIKNNILDRFGKPVKYSTSPGRHIGITNRLYSGFRLIDIQAMTMQASQDVIIDDYSHVLPQKLKLKTINDKSLTDNSFKGRVFIGDESIILRRPFANKLFEIGVCSDNSNCKFELLECFECNYFVPSENALSYFFENLNLLERKSETYKHQPFLIENINANIEKYKSIINKIQKGN